MIGQLIAQRYELLQEAEAGPVFAAFRARDRVTQREIKLRLLVDRLDEEMEFVADLRGVVDRLASVPHPNLEKVIQWHHSETPPFLISEWTAGVTLEDRLRRLSSFSVSVSVGMLISIGEAVAALHQAGMVHGDLSPRNVLCTQSDAVKLTLGGFWESYGKSERVAKAMMRGMVPYMAPELNQGQLPSQRSDVYAMGVMLYQMLTGRLPFPGDSTMAIVARHASGEYLPMRSINSSVPQAVEELVAKCLARNAFERYGSVDHLVSDLRAVSDALRFGRPLSWPIRAGAGGEVDTPIAPSLNVVNPDERLDPTVYGSMPTRNTGAGVPLRGAEGAAPSAEPMSAGRGGGRGKGAAAAGAAAAPTGRKAKRNRERDGLTGCFTWLFVTLALAVLGVVGWFIYFNSTKPAEVKMPNLVGKSMKEAEEEMARYGVTLQVMRREMSERYARDTIIQTDPRPGSMVRENAFAMVVLSTGSREVEVPDLAKMRVSTARELLDSLDLSLDDSQERVRSREIPAGSIVSQQPKSGSKVERGTVIRVQVSSGNRGSASGRSRKYEYTIAFPVDSDGEGTVAVRVEMTDDQQTRTVYEKKVARGERVRVTAEGFGEQATFRVFFDDELRGEKTVQAPELVGESPRSASEVEVSP